MSEIIKPVPDMQLQENAGSDPLSNEDMKEIPSVEQSEDKSEEVITELKDTQLAEGSLSCVIPENRLFTQLLNKEVLLVMQSDQLNILGQVFRPIFCGTVVNVTNGFLTLDPAIIKMSNAPFFRFPTPLCFPLERITYFLPFDCRTRIPIP